MKYLPIILFITLLFSCDIDLNTIYIPDYQADIQFLKDSLPAKHPNLFFHQEEAEFHKNLDLVASGQNLSIKQKAEVLMQLREVIAQLGDPHTNFGFYELLDSAGYYPIEIFWFADGIWITGAAEPYRSMIGKKLTAINDIPMATVIEKVSNVVPKNEPYFSHKRMHYFLPKEAILAYYNITKGDSASFTLETANGEQEKVQVPVTVGAYSVDAFVHLENAPYYWQSVLSDLGDLFRLRYFEQDSILFVQYNSCWGRELEARFGDKEEAKGLPLFSEFKAEIFEVLETQPVNKLLFDLRFNGGGSSPQGTELIEALSEIETINQKGKLFVAISQHTFSSAVINAMNFRQKTEAILLGQPSGGSPNHYGEVRTLVMPNTKLEVYHSTNYFKYVEEDLKAVEPDVLIDTKFADILNGKDPVYEFVKAY